MNTLEEAIRSFLLHCTFEKRLSQRTLKAYSQDLNQFEGFCREKGFSRIVTEIDKQAIKSYLQFIADAKPKTIKRKLATVTPPKTLGHDYQ